jgi:hypothetical protein
VLAVAEHGSWKWHESSSNEFPVKGYYFLQSLKRTFCYILVKKLQYQEYNCYAMYMKIAQNVHNRYISTYSQGAPCT